MKKILAALALAGSVALLGASPALATYTPEETDVAVSNAEPAVGETFVFSGEGMLPNEPVTITVELVDEAAPAAGSQSVASKINVFLAPQTFSTTADSTGAFAIELKLTEVGTYALTAKGDISGTQVGPVYVKVVASLANSGTNSAGAGLANTGTGSGLANTGADSGLVLWTLVGAGALAAGATSVVVVRRRAKVEAAA